MMHRPVSQAPLDPRGPRRARAVPFVVLAVACGLVLGACASTGDGGERGPRSRADLITQEQIEANSFETALDIVRSLRPSWLRNRPSSINNPEAGEVEVYVDGVRMIGGPDSLRQLRAETVRQLQFMTPSDATTRFGTGHAGGAILVTTHRG